MRNIRFNKVNKFLLGGAAQSPSNLNNLKQKTYQEQFNYNLTIPQNPIWTKQILPIDKQLDAFNKIMAFGENSSNPDLVEQSRIMHQQQADAQYNFPINVERNPSFDGTNNFFNIQLGNKQTDIESNNTVTNPSNQQKASTNMNPTTNVNPTTTGAENPSSIENQVNPSTGNRVVLGGNSGSTNRAPDKFDELRAQKNAQNTAYINMGLNLAQAGMYALGANSNDSKGTNIARGAVETSSEILSKMPPPANIAAPILKGLNLADSILDKAHVGKYNDNFKMDQYTFEKVGGSYGSTLNKANEAERLSGQRHGYLGIGGRKARDKDNAKIAEAKRQQGIMATIANENDDIKNGAEAMSDINHIHNSIFLAGGYNPNYARAAKEGGTIDFQNDTEIKEVLSFEDFLNIPEVLSFENYMDSIQQFKEGGELKSPNNIESDANVIPEGALHKNKHNLKNIGFDDSEITKKGIPVVDENGNQQAEIELNEIIFSLEVTKFLEDNYHKFYDNSTKEKEKEELALNVGKELVFQILENTKDNTGLIQVAKDGGKLNN